VADASETLEDIITDFWDDQDDPLLSNQEATTVADTTAIVDTCPEQADVTVTTTTATVNASSAVTFTIVAGGSGDKTITIQVVDTDSVAVSDEFELHLWFITDLLNKSEIAMTPPDASPGWAEKHVVTGTDGSYVLFVSSTASFTGYLVCSLSGVVSVSTQLVV